MKIFRLILPLALVVGLGACAKQPANTNDCPGGVSATFRDLTGLDGCGYVLQLADGTHLEVANLDELEVQPADGLNVRVAYSAPLNMGSICMVGPLVQVTCIIAQTQE